MSIAEIMYGSAVEMCGKFSRDLHKFSQNRSTPEAAYEIPWLITSLARRGLTVSESRGLIAKIENREWERIPEFQFHLLLGARWDHDALHGQRPKYRPNDEFDRWRTVVALVHSDFFITDGYIADLCRRADTDRYSSTVVLSVQQADVILGALEEFLSFTPEHTSFPAETANEFA
jgi:hypothetical protein